MAIKGSRYDKSVKFGCTNVVDQVAVSVTRQVDSVENSPSYYIQHTAVLIKYSLYQKGAFFYTAGIPSKIKEKKVMVVCPKKSVVYANNYIYTSVT